jgi:hypothetical protein
MAVQWLRRLVTYLSPHRPGFASRMDVGFVVDKVVLGQVRVSSVSDMDCPAVPDYNFLIFICLSFFKVVHLPSFPFNQMSSDFLYFFLCNERREWTINLLMLKEKFLCKSLSKLFFKVNLVTWFNELKKIINCLRWIRSSTGNWLHLFHCKIGNRISKK